MAPLHVVFFASCQSLFACLNYANKQDFQLCSRFAKKQNDYWLHLAAKKTLDKSFG